MPMLNFHSARVRDPRSFLDKAWATITIKPGIQLVLGKLKKDGLKGPTTAQSYRFDKSKFTEDQVKQWLKKHKIKTILFEPAKKEVKEMSQMAREIVNELCKTPGLRIRSKGKGRGLARGKGKGPLGVPFREISTVANIAPNVKPRSTVIRRKKKMSEQKVVAVGGDSLYGLKGSYENLKEKIKKALVDTQLYGKYPSVVSTFPKKVFIAMNSDDSESERYFEIEWHLEGDEVKLGIAREIERQIKFIVKEMAEQVKSSLFVPLVEKAWTTAFINDLPDSAFAYVETGGKKDKDGKTVPRSLRHFPLKDKDGNWDRAHVISALQRLNQTALSDNVKKQIKLKIKTAYKSLDLRFPGEDKK